FQMLARTSICPGHGSERDRTHGGGFVGRPSNLSLSCRSALRGLGPPNTHTRTHSHPPYSHLDALSSRSSSRGCTTAAGGSWVFRGRRISWRSG
uniref:Uncharacterized protein n=1 Tax=Malurus cyaneus samueli TaxID=2593467 RepID=A0A8C5TRK3_9PASS